MKLQLSCAGFCAGLSIRRMVGRGVEAWSFYDVMFLLTRNFFMIYLS